MTDRDICEECKLPPDSVRVGGAAADAGELTIAIAGAEL